LEKWKQKLGANATYNNLIKVFEKASYEDFAEIVKDLVMKNVQTNTNRNTINQTESPHPPSEPQSPDSLERSSESPSYAAAAKVKLLHEDYEPGT
jgi:hypothetical protein